MVSCFSNNVHPCGGVITEDLVLNGDDGIHTDFEGVYLTLGSLGETSISVTWHNDTDKEVVYGEDYSIEKLEDGEWVSVQTAEMSVPAIGIILMPHSESKKGYSTAPFNLSELGRYRLRCEFYPGEGTCNTWVEFDVAEKAEGDVNRIPDADITTFAEFLDREGFVKGMSQGQLLGLAEKYAEGLDPAIVPVYYHYDSKYGGGCRASSALFGYENDYYAKDGRVCYTNSFYAEVEIENLVLPCGIKYGDRFGDVLEKLGIDRNVYQKNNSGTNLETLPLYNDGKATFTLVNWALTPAPVEMLYHYELIYTDKLDTLTRTVKLSFTDGENRLARIDIETIDEYEK